MMREKTNANCPHVTGSSEDSERYASESTGMYFPKYMDK
jgi:hypothetical protein